MSPVFQLLLCAQSVFSFTCQAQDYEQLLRSAKMSLSEAVTHYLKSSKVPGVALGVRIEEYKGRHQFVISAAQGTQTYSFSFDTIEGKMRLASRSSIDESNLANALKISLADAIESAAKEAKGAAVQARFQLNGDLKPECVVRVYDKGKTKIAIVDGVSGKVTSVKDAE